MLRIIPKKWRRSVDADPVSRPAWWRRRRAGAGADGFIGDTTLATAMMPALPPASAGMAYALDRTGKHVYAGTVPPAEVQRRRAANRVASQSRRTNRGNW